MILESPFLALTPTVDGDVLRAIASSHDEFTVSRLQRLVPGRSISGLRRAADRLAEHGLLTARDVGRTRVYSFNERHLLADAVRSIADARGRLLRRLQVEVEGWDHPPFYGALFGSAARGDMHPNSDIDIFLACPAESDHDWTATIGALIDDVSDWTGNDARVVEIHVDQLAAPQHRPLFESVIRDGVPFAGDSNWLRHALAKTAA